MNRWTAVACLVIGIAAPNSLASSPDAEPQKIVSQDIGCRDLSFLSGLYKYLEQKDLDVFKREVLDAVSSGKCTLFTVGEQVYVSESLPFSVKLRRKGEAREFWVSPSVLGASSDASNAQEPETGTRALPKVQRGGKP